MSRVGLVTALLPPVVGGTQMLVWRLFHDDPNLVVVSGVNETVIPTIEGYSALAAPTLHLPYPRLRGYRFGLAPVLGAVSSGWLAVALARVIRFLESQRVDHVVSIPHTGPFALLGVLAAHRLRIPHTLYILDAWEEASMGPIERAFIRWGLRFAARMPRSRLAVVSPALGAHYRKAFGFRDVTWIPNPAPLPAEQVTTGVKAESLSFSSRGRQAVQHHRPPMRRAKRSSLQSRQEVRPHWTFVWPRGFLERALTMTTASSRNSILRQKSPPCRGGRRCSWSQPMSTTHRRPRWAISPVACPSTSRRAGQFF